MTAMMISIGVSIAVYCSYKFGSILFNFQYLLVQKWFGIGTVPLKKAKDYLSPFTVNYISFLRPLGHPVRFF